MTKWTFLPANYRDYNCMERHHMLGEAYTEKGVRRIRATCADKVVDAPASLFSEGWLTWDEAKALAQQCNLCSKVTHEAW